MMGMVPAMMPAQTCAKPQYAVTALPSQARRVTTVIRQMVMAVMPIAPLRIAAMACSMQVKRVMTAMRALAMAAHLPASKKTAGPVVGQRLVPADEFAPVT